MKIGPSFSGFDISAKGLSVQRKRMNLIAENIANADVTKTADGQPYKRKFLEITASKNQFADSLASEGNTLPLNVTEAGHIPFQAPTPLANTTDKNINVNEVTDKKQGNIVYMPESPDANADGYVEESNVNIVTEMVDMISATRSYEANLTALNSSKQLSKDSLEI
ncbi:MAG: flagellar basal body rod protein FlgC [Ignavibacteriaceae bacterium]|nr:flagellar basal body rod protein FlgC [Ignavibacteriaceae bacterium]